MMCKAKVLSLTGLILVAVITVLTGCSAIGANSVAETTIQTFRSSGNTMVFTVKVVPDRSKIVLGDTYSVVLESHDSYIFSHSEVQWLSSEFRISTPVNTRDISAQIEATKVRGVRELTLTAPQTDKDIYPMLTELSSLQQKMFDEKEKDTMKAWEAWTQKGSLSPIDPNRYNITDSDYQRIAGKYVKVVIMPYSEYLKLISAQMTPVGGK